MGEGLQYDTLTGTSIIDAAKWLHEGEVIGLPTETVYGLAGNALNATAVARIFEVKQRPSFNPLIVHVGSVEQAGEYAQLNPIASKLMEVFWPGPLTLLLKKKPVVPDLVTAGSDYVGIRMPNHPLTLELLRTLPFPLAAPSANPFMYVSPTNAKHVVQQLGGKIPYILDGGPSRVGLESTIIGFNPDGKAVLYRAGGLAVEELESIIGPVIIPGGKNEAPLAAPGQLKRHYATNKPMLPITEAPNSWYQEPTSIAFLGFDIVPAKVNALGISAHLLAPNGSLSTAATHLFEVMRQLDDNQAVKRIIVGSFPKTGLGRAINDRLQRAYNKGPAVTQDLLFQ